MTARKVTVSQVACGREKEFKVWDAEHNTRPTGFLQGYEAFTEAGALESQVATAC